MMIVNGDAVIASPFLCFGIFSDDSRRQLFKDYPFVWGGFFRELIQCD